MTEQACPLPTPPNPEDRAPIDRMLHAKRIAVVGLSDDPSRASFQVSQYLREHGYDIIPVNPNCSSVMGLPCRPTLHDVDQPIDVVLVFRRPEFCPDVTRQAIAARAKGVWLQSGIRSDEAQRLARDANIDFVQDRCMMVMHMRS